MAALDVDFERIKQAATRIAPYVKRTPVLVSEHVDRELGANVFFKAEGLQRTGAFKFRGAANAVFQLSDEDVKSGVATHSSGNHAAALALATRLRGAKAFVVMPSDASRTKRRLVEREGGIIETCEPTLAGREELLERVQARTGARLVHPYDDPHVIAGQGTAALELLEEVPDLDALVVPVGGGGLASGTALAAHGLNPRLRVYGSEPKLADDAARSLEAGARQPPTGKLTVADGLRAALSERTFTILKAQLESVVTVEEQDILDAMSWLSSELRILVEPSSAVPIAALRRRAVAARRIGVILSGGNVDLPRG